MATNILMPFDVMLKDKYVCTMKMTVANHHIIGYSGDKPIIDISKEQYRAFVEKQRPSLKGKKYHIEHITKTT